MTWLVEGRPLRRVLVSRLRYLGDVVMSTVVLEALRVGDPQLRLDYLCEAPHAPVLTGHPLLKLVHGLRADRRGADARARLGPVGAAGDGSLGPGEMIGALRAERYDLAVDLFFNPRSAWLLRLAGVPLRLGGARGSRRWLYSHTSLRKEVAAAHPGFNTAAPGGLGEHLCRLAPLVHGPSGLPFAPWLAENFPAGRLRPRLPVPDLEAPAQAALAALGLPPGQAYLLLVPGATWPSKEWPLDHWRDLTARLAARRPEALLVLAPPGSGHPWGQLGQVIPAGRGGVLPVLPLPTVLQLLGSARGVVSVDGGIMHAAVGLGIPTVALFGPTRTDAWFPYEGAGPFRVLCTRPFCHPCDLHRCGDFVCLPGIAPETVERTVTAVLDRNAEPHPDRAGS